MLPTTDSGPPVKKRKKERACDACRRRKTKCDGPLMPNSLCTNCMQTRKPCTYVEASKPRGPPKAYITALEDKVEALEALLEQVRPGVDFSDELGPRVIRDSWKNGTSSSPSSHTSVREPATPSNGLAPILLPFGSSDNEAVSHSFVFRSPHSTHLKFHSHARAKRTETNSNATMSYRDSHNISDDDSTTDTASSLSDTEEIVITSLIGRTKITLRASDDEDSAGDNNIRFHGRSSTAGLVEATRQFKHMHMQDSSSPPSIPDNISVAQTRRPQFWKSPTWEVRTDSTGMETPESFLRRFPPEDLGSVLIELYFQHCNCIFPLLHKPTFDRQWKDELYRRNIWFSCVCVSMFAIASRWCSDERVLPDDAFGTHDNPDWTKAGRHYFDVAIDIHQARKSIFHPASLFEVQTFTLMALYLAGTHAYPTGWIMVSAGIRRAQDVGAHRKRVYRPETNVDDELWKRAFWHLVVLDRMGGAHLGRACGLAEEDFDLDMPLEVDDEYWEIERDAEESFKQPSGVPSLITAFNELIKVTQIMAFTMRTLYAIDKSKFYRAIVPLDKGSLINQLSITLDKWKERLPDHLQMRQNFDVSAFSNQTTILQSTYHLTRMLIYRTLIPISFFKLQNESHVPHPSKSMPLTATDIQQASLICTDAAKSCAAIINLQMQQGTNHFFVPGIINTAFLCAAFLSGNVWHLKLQERDACNVSIDIKPPLAHSIEENNTAIKIFMQALEEVKVRWDIVTPLLRVLDGLSSEDPAPVTIKSDIPASQGIDYQPSVRLVDTKAQQRKHLHRPIFSSASKGYHSSNVPMLMDSVGRSFVENSAKVISGNDIRGPHVKTHDQDDNTPMNGIRSSLTSPGRARAISMNSNDTQWRERPSPFINSSMRRTSVPNLFKMNAQYSSEETMSHPRLYSHAPGSIVVQSSTEVRFEDVNMHFEHELYASNSHYTQHDLVRPPLPPMYVVQDYARGPYDTGEYRSIT